MRTRLIRPEFWTDSNMADLSPAVRLTYVGLWCLADDAGFLIWDRREIAAQLYRYANVKRRERDVNAHLEALLAARRVRLLDCEVHALIPSIPDHRIKGGEQLYTVQKQHERRCTTPDSVGLRRDTSDSVSVSSSSSLTSSLSVSVAREELAPSDEEAKRVLDEQWGSRRRKPAAVAVH